MTHTDVYVLLFTAFFVSLCCVRLMSRAQQSLDCQAILDSLHPYQLKGLKELVESDQAADVWERSRGLAGLWKRWRNRTVYTRLVQACVATSDASNDEMEELFRLSRKLTLLSFKALLLHTVSQLSPEVACNASLEALKLYSRIAFQTHALYADHDAPLCAHRIASLL